MKAKKAEEMIDKLIGNNGFQNMAYFPSLLLKLITKITILSPFGKPKNRVSKYFGYNQFEYVGGVSDRFIFGVVKLLI